MANITIPRWIRWTVWIVFTILWTWALLSPIPIDADTSRRHATLLFYIHKMTHVLMYALYACLTAWLEPRSPMWRWYFVAFLAAHAAGIEYAQNWAPGRYATWHDVGLNLVGLSIGIWLSWRWCGEGPNRRPKKT